MSEERIDVHFLRRRWKPHKLRLQAERSDHPTPIRFHRACSWLARVESMSEDDADLALIAQWIALNSLYGQWDAVQHTPVADRECWRVFLDRILDLDADQRIVALLERHKPLVISLLDDQYLSGLFWHDPRESQAVKAARKKLQAQKWYVEKCWKLILDAVVERIYLMRCQLIHGAATFGGKLNRQSLRRCSQMLAHLLPTVLLVLIDHGADEDWGIMCYPPVRSSADHSLSLRTRR